MIRRITSPHSGPFELDALNRFASTSYRTHCLSPGLAAEEDAELASLADWFSTVAFHSSSPSLAGWLSVVAGAESGADAVGLLGDACVFSSKSMTVSGLFCRAWCGDLDLLVLGNAGVIGAGAGVPGAEAGSAGVRGACPSGGPRGV